MKKYTPQQQQVLDHLRSGDHITQLHALGVYKIFRLSAIIYVLRQDGYEIRKEFHLDKTDRKYARYEFSPTQKRSKKPVNPLRGVSLTSNEELAKKYGAYLEADGCSQQYSEQESVNFLNYLLRDEA